MGEGIEREYRRRRAVPTVYLGLGAVVVVVGVNALWVLTLGGPLGWDQLTVAIWLGVGCRVALEHWRARTWVTGEGITVRGPLRTRARAWSEVYGIRVDGGGRGSPRWPAYLYDTAGRRIRLFQLDEQQLDDPIGEVADLCGTAVRLGLMSAAARPELEELIRRGARRRTALRWAVVACLVVAVAAFVVFTWLLFTDRPTHTVWLLLVLPVLCFPVFFLLLYRFGVTRRL